jgi:hypothetical protein
LENQGLDIGVGTAGVPGDAGAVRPIDAVEPLTVSASHPAEDSSGADAELPCDLVEGQSATDGSDHLTPVLSYTIVLLIEASFGVVGFS